MVSFVDRRLYYCHATATATKTLCPHQWLCESYLMDTSNVGRVKLITAVYTAYSVKGV